MIIRTYRCDDCEAVFEVTLDNGEMGDPDCPNCTKVLQWQPTSFNTTGNKSKAIDYTEHVLEHDYGLSNYKTGMKEGEVGYIDPTRKTTAELDKIGQHESEVGRAVIEKFSVPAKEQPKVDGFFGGQGVQIGQNRIDARTMIAMGKSGPGVTDPMAMFHQGIKSGKIPKVQNNILARADLSGKLVK